MTTKTIARLKGAPTTTSAFVGDLLFKSMATASGVDRDSAQASFDAEGFLDAEFIASPKACFGWAFADVRQKQHVGQIHERLSWEREALRSESLLLRWSVGHGKEKRTETVFEVTLRPGPVSDDDFDPCAKRIGSFYDQLSSSEKALAHDALAQFKLRFHWHRANLSTHEVRRFVEHKLTEARATKIGPSLWFVPPGAHDVSERLQRAVHGARAGDIAVFPQFDNAIGNAHASRMVRASLLDEVADVKRELRELQERDARDSAIQARVERLRELRDRAAACVAVLGAQVEQIRTAVRDALEATVGATEDEDGDIPEAAAS